MPFRWPWVSRHAYDLVVDQLQQRTAAHDRLVQQMVTLKRKGYEMPQAGKVRLQPDEERKALARSSSDSWRRRALVIESSSTPPCRI
jgi:hypothetical protein